MNHTQGAVYVEFLVVFFPLTLLWLGIAQLGLLYAAELLVEHAAARAARAAIVILPDEIGEYKGDVLNTVSEDNGLKAYASAKPEGRLDAIRRAARLTLTLISPAIGNAVHGLLAGWLYTERAVAVTFPDSASYRTAFQPTEPVTVRVTYLYRCPIPVVNLLICSAYDGRAVSANARAELDTVGARALEQGAKTIATGTDGSWRFVALHAERTMPNQGRRP